jgi:hypothetical protein
MKMKFNRLAFVIAFVLTAVLFAEVALHAQEATPSTKITGSQSTDTLLEKTAQGRHQISGEVN